MKTSLYQFEAMIEGSMCAQGQISVMRRVHQVACVARKIE
jgi:hypothetical protein